MPTQQLLEAYSRLQQQVAGLTCIETILAAIVDASFEQTPVDYRAETEALNDRLDLRGDLAFRGNIAPGARNPSWQGARAKFFTGDPTQLRQGRYLLFLSMNHKFEDGPDYQAEIGALNDTPATHLPACQNYFTSPPELHNFFNRLVVPTSAFAEAMEPSPSATTNAEILNRFSFFMDALPYFSTRSKRYNILALPAGSLSTENTPYQVLLNNLAIERVLEVCPPAAVVLNGSTSHEVLDARTANPISWQYYTLKNQTADGDCWIGAARCSFAGQETPVVCCNFIGSRWGPNSTAQQEELGNVLAQFDGLLAGEVLKSGRGTRSTRQRRRPRGKVPKVDRTPFLEWACGYLKTISKRKVRWPKRAHYAFVMIGDGLSLTIEASRNQHKIERDRGVLEIRVQVCAHEDHRRPKLERLLSVVQDATIPSGTQVAGPRKRPGRDIGLCWAHIDRDDIDGFDQDCALAEECVRWWIRFLRSKRLALDHVC